MTDDEHVQYVLEAMIEIHGPVAEEQYTGKYVFRPLMYIDPVLIGLRQSRHNRQCWLLDENIAAAWAAPVVGQHELYIPAYFETENNVTSGRTRGSPGAAC